MSQVDANQVNHVIYLLIVSLISRIFQRKMSEVGNGTVTITSGSKEERIGRNLWSPSGIKSQMPLPAGAPWGPWYWWHRRPIRNSSSSLESPQNLLPVPRGSPPAFLKYTLNHYSSANPASRPAIDFSRGSALLLLSAMVGIGIKIQSKFGDTIVLNQKVSRFRRQPSSRQEILVLAVHC